MYIRIDEFRNNKSEIKWPTDPNIMFDCENVGAMNDVVMLVHATHWE
jgi:hypothetical protein